MSVTKIRYVTVFTLLLFLAFMDKLINVEFHGQYNWLILPFVTIWSLIVALLEKGNSNRLFWGSTSLLLVVILWTIPSSEWREGVRLVCTVILFFMLFHIVTFYPNTQVESFRYVIAIMIAAGIIFSIYQIVENPSQRVSGYILGSPTSFAIANLIIFFWPKPLSHYRSINRALRMLAILPIIFSKTVIAVLLLVAWFLFKFAQHLAIALRFVFVDMRVHKASAGRILLRSQKKAHRLLVLIVLIVLVFSVGMLRIELIEGIERYAREDWQSSIMTRMSIYTALLDISGILWLVGQGVGSSYAKTKSLFGQNVVPHWDVAVLLHDFGIIGSIIVISIFVWTLWPLLTRHSANWMILAIVSVGTFHNLLYNPFLVALIAVALGVANSTNNHGTVKKL